MRNNKKRMVMVMLIGTLMTNLFGCGSASQKDVEKYLGEKYSKLEYEYVNKSATGWPSNMVTYTFKDGEGVEFTVKEDSGVIMDNYYSHMFDKQITAVINEKLAGLGRTTVSSESNSTGSNVAYENAIEYIKDTAFINVTAFIEGSDVTKENAALKIKERVEGLGGKLYVKVYIVPEGVSSQITADYNRPVSKDIIAEGSFQLEKDGTIKSETWEK